ncbi:MAG: four-carbon acid sugar kinase family protein [Clostridia bacterium]|nr:four-carbon acid sugar kinase family protein [Clostridia bacterium]
MENEISKLKYYADLSPAEEQAVDRRYSEALESLSDKIIVLDDDPTGVQTVHDIYVYTDWSKESIRDGLLSPQRMFFILTNSRSLTEDETIRLHTVISRNIAEVALELGIGYILVSRSDSTLRGHYPAETETIRDVTEECLHMKFDGEIFYPFFLEGGRYTLGSIHYVYENGSLTPAHLTEFSRDRTFGFKTAYLPGYIEEKTKGRYRAGDVTCISLDDLRAGNVEKVTQQLMEIHDFGKVVVNSAGYSDVKVFCTALIHALNNGRHFLFRTAASFARVIGGVEGRPLLSRSEIVEEGSRHGGLIVIGSHVKKTTEQLDELKTLCGICFIELNQHLVFNPEALEQEVLRVVVEASVRIAAGETVAVFTRRDRIDFNSGDREDELRMSARISDAVTSVVTKLIIRPSFLIAKGGITSSDIGTKGLGVKKALVAGQVKPGVPVWITGPESRFPGLPYVIFPGNVGSRDTLKEIVAELM